MQREKGQDLNAYYREIEKDLTLTVISAAPNDMACQGCANRTLIFHCHVFREGKVEDLCKPCAVERAGGEAKVWVRTDSYLRQKWAKGARLDKPRWLRVRRGRTRSGEKQAP